MNGKINTVTQDKQLGWKNSDEYGHSWGTVETMKDQIKIAAVKMLLD